MPRGIATTEEHGRKIYVNEDWSGREPRESMRGAKAVGAGLLEQQGKSMEAGAWSEYGLDAGGAVSRGGDQPVLGHESAQSATCQDRGGQRPRPSASQEEIERRS